MRSEDESTEGAISDHHENAFPVENEQLNSEDGIVERRVMIGGTVHWIQSQSRSGC